MTTSALVDRARALGRTVTGHLARRCEWYLVPLFYTLVVVVLHREVFLVGQKGVGWDLIESYWPDLAFFARELGHGNFPIWNPTERGGVPAHADPQNGIFYPVQWLLAGWAVLVGETSWLLIQVKEFLHHVLAASLLYLFARTRRLPWQAALLAGWVMIVCEAWVQLKSNNFLQAVAWTPLVWIATDALLARPSWTRAAGLAAALYLPASVGSPPGYFYMLLGAGLYGVYRVGVFVVSELAARPLSGPTGRAGRRQTLTALGRAALFIGLAALLVAATQALLLLPVRDLLALSPRAERTVDFAVQGQSGSIKTLTALVAPLRDTYTVHCGLLTPVLCAVALLLRPRRDRGAPIFFAFATIFFLLCAFGPETPVLRYLVVTFPGFGFFRASARYLVVVPLAMGAWAAYGLAILLEPRSRLRHRVALLGLIGAATIAGTTWLKKFDPELIFNPAAPQQPAVIAAFLACFVIAIVVMPRRLSGPLAAVGVFVFFAFATQISRRELGYQPRPDNLEDLAKIKDLPDLDKYRIYDEFLLEQRAGSRLGLREFRGYPSEDPLSRNDYNLILAYATRPEGLPVLGEFNIRYVFYGPHSTKGWSRRRLPNAPDVVAPKRYVGRAPHIYEARFPAPLAAWYGALRQVAPGEVLPALQAARDDKGDRRLAVLTEGMTPAAVEARVKPLLAAASAPPASVTGKVTLFSTEQIDVDVEAPAAGLVVLNEFMFTGWRVFVDGQEDTPLWVDLALRGVLVGPGKHRIVWRYVPPHWSLLITLWLAGMAAFLAALFATLRRRVR